MSRSSVQPSPVAMPTLWWSTSTRPWRSRQAATRLAAVVLARDVGGHHARGLADRLGGLARGCLVAVGEHHGRALAGERDRRGAPVADLPCPRVWPAPVTIATLPASRSLTSSRGPRQLLGVERGVGLEARARDQHRDRRVVPITISSSTTCARAEPLGRLRDLLLGRGALGDGRARQAQHERLIGVERRVVVAAGLDRVDLLAGGADGPGDRVVLDPLVLGADLMSHLEDGQLTQQRVELELGQQRPAVSEPGAVGASRRGRPSGTASAAPGRSRGSARPAGSRGMRGPLSSGTLSA